jgi:AcrR family transcriptional regulator
VFVVHAVHHHPSLGVQPRDPVARADDEAAQEWAEFNGAMCQTAMVTDADDGGVQEIRCDKDQCAEYEKRLTGAQRRAQLLRVGRAVFAKHGYDGGSVEEIARAAGVSKPIVYEHFGGKEGIYAVIVDREMDALVQRIATVISEGSPRQRFERAVLAFMTYVKDEPDGFAVLTRDAPMSIEGRGLPSVISELADRVGDIFYQQLKDAGLNPKFAPVYAYSLIGMVTLSGQWWLENQDLDMETVAKHVAAMGWMGLRHIPARPDFSE